MARNRNSMQYTLLKCALEGVMNNNTARTYKKLIKRFCIWAKESGYKRADQIDSKCIQEYEVWLENNPKCYTANTIHKYLAPICKAAQVPMDQIRKPKRTSFCIVRGRSVASTGEVLNRNERVKMQEADPHYKRLVEFQRAVGIRRAELSRLTGADCICNGNDLYVRVRKGKGGKDQLQYILPEDHDVVLKTFGNIKQNETVFSPTEMKNIINLHGLRQEHARKCYEYFKNRINNDPTYAPTLREMLLSRWDEGHERLKEQNYKVWLSQRKHFIYETRNEAWRLRGENRIKALNTGRPIEYNRLALLAVSVLDLSHYRISVTVNNYIL